MVQPSFLHCPNYFSPCRVCVFLTLTLSVSTCNCKFERRNSGEFLALVCLVSLPWCESKEEEDGGAAGDLWPKGELGG